MNLKFVFKETGEVLSSLIIINQSPDELRHFIIKTKGAWSIFKLSLRFSSFSLQF